VEASYIISAAYSSFPKGTVHLIGVDMELNKENQHIVMQWNDSYFIAADNGILSMLSQKLFLKEWLLLIFTIARPARQLALMFCFSCHIAKGGLLNVIGKEINSLKQITEKASISHDTNMFKGHVVYIDHF
jgi:S-adenosylmethionine hydrolase